MLIVGMILLFSIGCAGMETQYQRNMLTNAGIWGMIGAGTGAAIAAVTKGDPVKGAVLGGIGGAFLGAGNTPAPTYAPPPRY